MQHDPTVDELAAAYDRLRAAGVASIGNISLGEVARLAADPDYARTPAECRLARALLIVATQEAR